MEINRVILLLIFAISCSRNDENFVTVKAGEYEIGDKNKSMNPLKTIKLNSFKISKFEVTNSEFEKFVLATNYLTDAEKFKNGQVFDSSLPEFEWKTDSTAYWRYPQGRKNGNIEGKMNHPVTCISYNDAITYCNWANVRLPLLEEWEVASRGHQNRKSFLDDKKNINQYANIWQGKNHQTIDTIDKYVFTSPVGSFLSSELGLYDMYGNVFELCLNKPEKIKQNKNLVAARGGSWWCSTNSCDFFNSHDIGILDKNASFSNVGFRVVKE